MKNFSKNRKGLSAETLVEVIIALGMMMTVMAGASSLYVSSQRSTAQSRNDLIAENLAAEGVEMVSSMVDTNFLKFAPQANQCWDARAYDGSVNLDNCDAPGNKIADGTYILKINPGNYKWELSAKSAALSADLSQSSDEEYILKLDPETSLYNHDLGVETRFYREIKIEKFSDPVAAQSMRITSRVLFRIGSQLRKIQRSLKINQPVS